MASLIKKSWALFTGIGIILVAHGLQGALMGVRSVIENFSSLSTGILMSGYFIGYFVGSNFTPTLVSRVGHIRVFAAFASMSSLVILIHAILISPLIWFLLRVLTGISMVCIYTVAESWLNDRSSNKNRGSVLSIYMVILYGAMGIGMFLLNFSTPKNFEPFILVSIITSLALIPILLTKKKAPNFKKIQAMTLKKLYEVSPFGIVSSFFYGTIQSALFTLLAVYATSMNFTILEISIVTFLLAVSGSLAQFPVGKISDLYDRRKIIIISTFGAAMFAILTIQASQQMYMPGDLATSKFWFYIFFILFSFCSLPMFSLILAYTNDYIPKEKFVAAGAGLQFVFGLGAMSGPFLCSIFMNIVGSNGFFLFLFFFHFVIGVFGIYRMKIRPTVDNPDSQFVAMPPTITPAGIELNPTTEHIEEPYSEKVKEILERKGVKYKKKNN